MKFEEKSIKKEKKLSQLGQLTKPATYITRREQPNKKQIQC